MIRFILMCYYFLFLFNLYALVYSDTVCAIFVVFFRREGEANHEVLHCIVYRFCCHRPPLSMFVSYSLSIRFRFLLVLVFV
jgi:hypothetical protein